MVDKRSYLGKDTTFDRAIVRFAEAYAQQNREDFAQVSEHALP